MRVLPALDRDDAADQYKAARGHVPRRASAEVGTPAATRIRFGAGASRSRSSLEGPLEAA
jgi:hypothetical protein